MTVLTTAVTDRAYTVYMSKDDKYSVLTDVITPSPTASPVANDKKRHDSPMKENVTSGTRSEGSKSG